MMVYPFVIIQFDHIVKCQKKRIIVETFKGNFNNWNDLSTKTKPKQNETKGESLMSDLNIIFLQKLNSVNYLNYQFNLISWC